MALPVVLAGAGGLLLGAFIIWLVCRSGSAGLATRLEEREAELVRVREQVAQAEGLRTEVGRLEATLAAERVTSAEKLALVDEARLRLQDAFKALSADALKANS
jgi:DNA recombination protein RmuC